MLLLGLLRVVQVLAIVLPAGLLLRLAELAGGLWADLDGRSRTSLERNLGRVLHGAEPHELRRVVRRNFQLYARGLAELALAAAGRSVPVTISAGVEKIQTALEEGHGVILVSGHLGAFDQAVAAFCGRGHRVLAVNENLRPPALYRWYVRARSRFGLDVLPLGEASRALIRRLRSGGMVGLMADRAIGEVGVQVSFFGEPARFPAGPAALALRTGAALIPAFALRDRDGGIDVFACPRLSVVPSGDRERDIAALTARWVRVLEEQVTRAPEQWHMLQPVWTAGKQADEGAASAQVGARMKDVSVVD